MSKQSKPQPNAIARAYRVRVYPKPDQARLLNRIFGARRFVWNWSIARKDEAWREQGKRINWVDLSREFTSLRRAEETSWLLGLPREPFNQTLRDFDKAFRNFFSGRARYPKRRRYGTINSARFTFDQRRIDATIDRKRGRLTLPGIGSLRFRVTETMVGRLRSVTITKDAAGRWFASIAADGVPASKETGPAGRKAVGVDLGLKDAAALSTGEVIAAGRHLDRKRKRLRRYQRKMSRQRDAAALRKGLNPAKPFPKGTRITPSMRMHRTKRKIGRLHAKVADTRKDFTHKLTHKLAHTADVICIEDLAVKAMSRGMGRRAFRRSVADAALGEIRRQVTYKAAWRGRAVSVVGRYYPSSKTCSGCGYRNGALKLKDRTWVCPGCGQNHHRDLNAALNIEREGLRLLAKATLSSASTAPDGDTRRSRGINARGVAVCASSKASLKGQPTTVNRELTYRQAKPDTTLQSRDGPACGVEG